MTTFAISGANRGIGLALVRALSARGIKVVALCRNASDDLALPGVVTLQGVDVAEPHTLADLPERLRNAGVQHIDVLINNAGILARQTLDNLDASAIDAMQRQFQVNSIGPILLTQSLLPLLGKGARVGIVTSRMGSITDNTSGGAYGYRMSKAAVNIAGVSLAHDLADRGIAVALLHPGYVRTDMTGHNGLIDPPEAAEGMLAVLDGLTLENSGGFWHSNGESLPW